VGGSFDVPAAIAVKYSEGEYAALAEELESFVHSVSHDLRAPVRAFSGYLEMFRRTYADQLDDEGRRRLAVLASEANRMGELMDGLLELSRIGRRPMHPAPVDMTALAREVSERERLRSANGKLVVHVGTLPWAHGDPVLLECVWEQLLSNAVKFASNTDDPVVIVAGDDASGEAVYTVKDNGAGFNVKYAGKLFGAFQRFHKAGEYPGVGIGLAIVQRILHRHGGRVWADARIGEGAVFSFALALAPHEP
jgi:light-regulated signal transduction histidine kinase (bacteriophytochrome)